MSCIGGRLYSLVGDFILFCDLNDILKKPIVCSTNRTSQNHNP